MSAGSYALEIRARLSCGIVDGPEDVVRTCRLIATFLLVAPSDIRVIAYLADEDDDVRVHVDKVHEKWNSMAVRSLAHDTSPIGYMEYLGNGKLNCMKVDVSCDPALKLILVALDARHQCKKCGAAYDSGVNRMRCESSHPSHPSGRTLTRGPLDVYDREAVASFWDGLGEAARRDILRMRHEDEVERMRDIMGVTSSILFENLMNATEGTMFFRVTNPVSSFEGLDDDALDRVAVAGDRVMRALIEAWTRHQEAQLLAMLDAEEVVEKKKRETKEKKKTKKRIIRLEKLIFSPGFDVLNGKKWFEDDDEY